MIDKEHRKALIVANVNQATANMLIDQLVNLSEQLEIAQTELAKLKESKGEQ